MIQPVRAPERILGRDGKPYDRLTELLRPARVTAFVGGGGKTSTILALAAELASDGARVIITTTTRIWPSYSGLPEAVRVIGTPMPSGKLGPSEHPETLIAACDHLLIEADGSKGLPAKAPGAYEPVIPSYAEQVIAVQGLRAPDRPIAAVCHRPELVCALFGKRPEELLTEEDCLTLLLHPDGQRKQVGARSFGIVWNQADTAQDVKRALRMAEKLPEAYRCAVTAYRQEEGR